MSECPFCPLFLTLLLRFFSSVGFTETASEHVQGASLQQVKKHRPSIYLLFRPAANFFSACTIFK